MKLWLGFWKCLLHSGPSVLQTLLLCVFILKFKLYSDFPTYSDFLQRQHSDTLRSCLSDYEGAFVKGTLKVEQVLIWLRHRIIDPVEYFLLLRLFTFKSPLLSKTLLPTIMSLRFLFLLNARIGRSAEIFQNLSSICKIYQFL